MPPDAHRLLRVSDNASSDPAPRAWGRRERLALTLLLALTALHWLPRLRGPIDLRYDGGVYYVLGTALARGEGYRLLNEPGTIEALQYPPLLPAAIALLQRLLGTEDPLRVGPVLRIAYAGLSFLLAGLAYSLARRRFGPWSAFLAAALPAFTFHTLFLEDLLFSEIPFTVVTLGFFLIAERRSLGARALSALLAAAAFFLRSAGLAVLAAWALWALVRRDWRAFVLRSGLAAGCLFLWQGHVARVRAGPEYATPAYAYQRAPYQFYNVSYAENLALLDPFRPEAGGLTAGALARRLTQNAAHLLTAAGESVSAPRGFLEWPSRALGRALGMGPPLFLATVTASLLGALVVAGLVLLARRGQGLWVLHVLVSAALIALLPWPVQVPRYLAPLAPFLALALVEALLWLAHRRRELALTLGLGLVAVQAFAALQTFTLYRRSVPLPGGGPDGVEQELFLFEDARAWRAFYAGLDWLRAHTPSDARVASTSPHLVWLHTGRLAVMPPFESDPAVAERLLDGVPVDYAVLDALDFIDIGPRYVEPMVRAREENWEHVFGTEDGLLAIYCRRR
jgi:hypothetical protein